MRPGVEPVTGDNKYRWFHFHIVDRRRVDRRFKAVQTRPDNISIINELLL